MPAQAGLQKPQAEAVGSPVWIPAFAGMTFPCLSIKTFLTEY
jgi:hypothetical protein